MSQNIVIDFSPAGSVKIEANGFNGVGCSEATEQIEIAIGGSGLRGKKDYKPEFSMPATTSQEQKSTF